MVTPSVLSKAYNSCVETITLHMLYYIYLVNANARKRFLHLLLSEGGIIRPCDLRICTSLTCLASLCTLGNGGTDFFVLPQPRHWHWNSTSTIFREDRCYFFASIGSVRFCKITIICLPLGAFTNDDCTWPFCSAIQWSMQSVISSNCQSQLSQQHSYTTSCVAFVPTETVVPFICPPSSFILIARSSQACFSPAGNFLHWNKSRFTCFAWSIPKYIIHIIHYKQLVKLLCR